MGLPHKLPLKSCSLNNMYISCYILPANMRSHTRSITYYTYHCLLLDGTSIKSISTNCVRKLPYIVYYACKRTQKTAIARLRVCKCVRVRKSAHIARGPNPNAHTTRWTKKSRTQRRCARYKRIIAAPVKPPRVAFHPLSLSFRVLERQSSQQTELVGCVLCRL